jgi:phosphatidylserine/phosphatidylglycerophosphate/cardiolipin synthase-like enzyme
VKRKITLIMLAFLWTSSYPCFSAETEVVFSPEGGIKECLLKEIDAATAILDLALYEITSSDLAQALSRAKHRGVRIRLIADSRQAKKKGSQVTYLISQGILTKVLGGREKRVMNHRFAILDGKKVVTGSFPWSEDSERLNFENIIVSSDTEAATAYQKEFDRLWREKRVIR